MMPKLIDTDMYFLQKDRKQMLSYCLNVAMTLLNSKRFQTLVSTYGIYHYICIVGIASIGTYLY